MKLKPLANLTHLLDSVEDGEAEVFGAALASPDAADHVGPVLDGLLRVEGALLAREALQELGLESSTSCWKVEELSLVSVNSCLLHPIQPAS